jgi:plastocyanin
VKLRLVGLFTLVGGAVLVLPALPAGAGGGCHREAAESAVTTGATTVVMEQICFTPGVLEVERGTAIRFVNRDPVPHAVAGTGWGAYENLVTGAEFEHTFEAPGIYAYSCYLHPSMNGAVVVTEADGARPVAITPTASTVTGGGDGTSGFDEAAVGLGAAGGAVVAGGAARLRRRGARLSSRP